jgi:hypothetical protein
MIGNPCKHASSHAPPLAIAGDAATTQTGRQIPIRRLDPDRRGPALAQHADFGTTDGMTTRQNGGYGDPACQVELMTVKAEYMEHVILPNHCQT